MHTLDPLALRVLGEVSVLFGRTLELADPAIEEPNTVFSQIGDQRIAIRARGSRPLRAVEKGLLSELVRLVHRDMLSETARLILDQRLRLLEKENLELSSRNAALAEISSRDSLTGLFNRWYVLDKIEVEMNRALRYGTSMSLLLLDIDHFKKVNDSFGHSTGDVVLQKVGSVLKESCRVYDVPGRYGGEEFCLMLPQTGLESTITVAERIRRRVEEDALRLGEGTVRVTTSIGVAGLDNRPEEGLVTPASLIDRADRALYTAKSRGRNRIEVWDSSLGSQQPAVDH